MWSPRGPLRWIALALAVVLTGAAGVALADGLDGDEALPAGVALRLDGKNVDAEELDRTVSTMKALYGITPPAAGSKEADAFRRDTAKSYVVGRVVDREVKRRGIVVSEQQARAELSKIIDGRLAGDRAAFTRFLGDVGLTEKTVLEEIERTIATSMLHEQVVKDVPDATLAQAKKEYADRRDEMTTPERRTLSNIVVESEADAEAVIEELKSGADFAAVAKKSSLDTSTKDKGGALGTVAAADLDPAYAEAAYAAKKGTAFGPVQSEFGWNVGLVTKIEPGDPLSFADVKVTLLSALTKIGRAHV